MNKSTENKLQPLALSSLISLDLLHFDKFTWGVPKTVLVLCLNLVTVQEKMFIVNLFKMIFFLSSIWVGYDTFTLNKA